MNIAVSPKKTAAAVGLALAAAAAFPTAACAQSVATDDGKWHGAVILYGYFPTIGGKTTFPVPEGSPGISVDARQIIENLKGTFMGTLDLHNGRWGVFTDLLYLNVGGSKAQSRDFRLGQVGIPASVTADLDLDLKGTIWTIAGEYRFVQDSAVTVDGVAGARYFGIKPKLSWNFNGDLGPLPLPGRGGSAEVTQNQWDGIAGIKGQYRFGANREWSLPFYADVGTGQSDVTWQVAGGIGYAFSWGDVLAMWRYLDYKFKSDQPIEDMNFNGPMVGVRFRW